MDQVIYVNENNRIMQKKINITEGGMARNIALMRWIKSNVTELNEVNLGNSRLINAMTTFYILLFKKKCKIIFQYISVGVPLHNERLLGKIMSWMFLKATKYSTHYNEIVFDISDLKYEQSIDLEINKEKIKVIEKFEEGFFNLQAKFIFASGAMQQYACNKYSIFYKNTDVCINGGNQIEKEYDVNEFEEIFYNKKLLLVYAGTLNKGRQVEEMISRFPNNSDVCLLLMGTDGEWIKEVIHNSNIYYLGAIEEEKAHYIVSRCDVGLIPYDNSRLYYNLAYPTKLSFYITAGIPFLSTPVKEIENIQLSYNFGYVALLKDWTDIIKDLSRTDINRKKGLIELNKNVFFWENIFSKNKFIY